MKKKWLIIVSALVLSLCLAFGLASCGEEQTATAPEKPVKIINPLTGEECPDGLPTRPVVVSIDNVGDAVPQSNLSYADMIYEFPVEGLQTRLECIFYSKHPEFVGPIRSTRPYFVDLTREYKGVFVAYGWSPDAKRYLKKKYVPWINGMVHTELYYRVSDKGAPHNAYIRWENIEKHAKAHGDWFSEEKRRIARPFLFRDPEAEAAAAEAAAAEEAAAEESEEATEATDPTVPTDENGEEIKKVEPKPCDSVKFDYRYSHCAFKYDKDKGVYKRTWKGAPYIDKESGKQMTCKNIIVQKVSSKVLDYKGRLAIDMCKGGKALLFTDGKVIKGTWSRKDLDHRTIFIDENGDEFRLTKGNTWVEVCDQNCDITYDK